MSQSNRNSAASVLFTHEPSASCGRADLRVVLDAVIRTHRDQLVQTAEHLLGDFPQDAEDIVQDVCLAVLDGDLETASDPAQALDELLGEVAGRAEAHRQGRQDRQGEGEQGEERGED